MDAEELQELAEEIESGEYKHLVVEIIMGCDNCGSFLDCGNLILPSQLTKEAFVCDFCQQWMCKECYLSKKNICKECIRNI